LAQFTLSFIFMVVVLIITFSFNYWVVSVKYFNFWVVTLMFLFVISKGVLDLH